MVFVYKGAGKTQPEDAPAEQRLCKKKACKIQRCLSQNNHNADKCAYEIREWEACCAKVREKEEAERPCVVK